MKSRGSRTLALTVALTVAMSVLAVIASSVPQLASGLFVFYLPAIYAASVVSRSDFPIIEILVACVFQNVLVALIASVLWEARRASRENDSTHSAPAESAKGSELSPNDVSAILLEVDPLNLDFVDDEYEVAAHAILEYLDGAATPPTLDTLSAAVSEILRAGAPSWAPPSAAECDQVAERLLARGILLPSN